VHEGTLPYWQEAIEAIPPAARRRIQAMVVDNLPGMQKIATKQQWLLQLCHFHLLLKLQAQRGRVRYKLRGGAVVSDENVEDALRATKYERIPP